MHLRTPSQVALVEYTVAPWHRRMRWWLLAQLWAWGRGLEELGVQSPEQANPLWRR